MVRPYPEREPMEAKESTAVAAKLAGNATRIVRFRPVSGSLNSSRRSTPNSRAAAMRNVSPYVTTTRRTNGRGMSRSTKGRARSSFSAGMTTSIVGLDGTKPEPSAPAKTRAAGPGRKRVFWMWVVTRRNQAHREGRACPHSAPKEGRAVEHPHGLALAGAGPEVAFVEVREYDGRRAVEVAIVGLVSEPSARPQDRQQTDVQERAKQIIQRDQKLHLADLPVALSWLNGIGTTARACDGPSQAPG